MDSLKTLVDGYGDQVFPIELDVTDRAAVFQALPVARAHFGRIDVVVNNAGYGHFGYIEELSEAEARQQMETDFFGALWVSQAAIPLMRSQEAGHIVQVSSVAGVAGFPGLGIYNASKWALEGFSEALAGEMAAFGVRVTLIEPGPFSTDWSGTSAAHSAPLTQYVGIRATMSGLTGSLPNGDPGGAARELLKIVDAESPPPRVLFGGFAFNMGIGSTQKRVDEWTAWEAVSRAADEA